MRWRTAVASTGIGCATASASAPRSSRPIRVRTTQRLTTKAARSHGLNRRASLTRATISLEAQTSKGEGCTGTSTRSEEHTSELQSLMRISYAVFCLKKKKNKQLHKHVI